ncbi:hypothetical protein E0Z10_g9464 [Xylaria hypoxylon]|uniref:Uncharacterized protein n=1 Tax=Xylaria hypoxylon TaxID=37992 RepID=A0A4Z0YJ20_9PEZI|nr:hypothetical protein E0Z10_g9464 [Xylaria hypoxylon]
MPSSKSKVPSNKCLRDKKYFQLWRRFYEPLVLLKILGNTRGEHSARLSQQSSVHRFLDNLAYLCDHDKGGSTTSAVGLENAPERFNFWIASNDPKQSAKSAPFLASILQETRIIADSPAGKKTSLQEKLVRRSIEFAKHRVKKEAKLLIRDISKCMRFFTGPEDTELSNWMGNFREKEPLELCYIAYQERDSPMMKRLSSRLQTRGDLSVTDGQSVAIKDTLHCLGRLAHHIRAPQQIIEDVSSHPGLRNVLDEFKVDPIRPHLIIDRPHAEPDIHIYSIMNRMLPCGGFDTRYKEAADSMNQRFDIVARFKEEYDNKNFNPLMHAEIQILEHFWDKRQFFNDDRYIGCSKPACYCCHLYMQHHPSRCVVPQTSRKVYVNWGLRELPQGSQDAEYKHQRDRLNEMVKSIRNDALDQILRKAPAEPWHPDSQTGFTLRAPSVRDEVHQPSEKALLMETVRMMDLGEYQSWLIPVGHPWCLELTETVDMATDSDESRPGSLGCYASGSRHSSLVSVSDDNTRGLRNLSWTYDEDSNEDSDEDPSDGGARL